MFWIFWEKVIDINQVINWFFGKTENLIQNSIKKMEEKLCDMIIANDVSKKGSG